MIYLKLMVKVLKFSSCSEINHLQFDHHALKQEFVQADREKDCYWVAVVKMIDLQWYHLKLDQDSISLRIVACPIFKKKFDSLMTLFLILTIVKLASYLVSIAVSYIHLSTLTIVKLASYLVSIAVSYIRPSTLTIVKLATYLVSIAVSFIHPSAFLFLPDIIKLSL